MFCSLNHHNFNHIGDLGRLSACVEFVSVRWGRVGFNVCRRRLGKYKFLAGRGLLFTDFAFLLFLSSSMQFPSRLGFLFCFIFCADLSYSGSQRRLRCSFLYDHSWFWCLYGWWWTSCSNVTFLASFVTMKNPATAQTLNIASLTYISTSFGATWVTIFRLNPCRFLCDVLVAWRITIFSFLSSCITTNRQATFISRIYILLFAWKHAFRGINFKEISRYNLAGVSSRNTPSAVSKFLFLASWEILCQMGFNDFSIWIVVINSIQF